MSEAGLHCPSGFALHYIFALLVLMGAGKNCLHKELISLVLETAARLFLPERNVYPCPFGKNIFPCEDTPEYIGSYVLSKIHPCSFAPGDLSCSLLSTVGLFPWLGRCSFHTWCLILLSIFNTQCRIHVLVWSHLTASAIAPSQQQIYCLQPEA